MTGSAARIAHETSVEKRSAVEPVLAALRVADERNPRLRALRCVERDAAVLAAKAVDARVAQGGRGLPLAGVPVVIKDNVAQAGRANPAGRRDGAGKVAPDDALVVERLVRAGAVLVGRANMDELAYGVTGANVHSGQVLNPWDERLHPGGSSAGSAAAVAAGMAVLAIGTDTAGSVRIPAALCGLAGLRPTPGLIPSSGIAPLAPSLDTAGPLANDTADLALMLSVLADTPELARAPENPSVPLRLLRFGVLRGTYAVPLSSGVAAAFDAAVELVATLGARTHDREIPELAEAPRACGPIIGSEATEAWRASLEEVPDDFGAEVASHIRKGMTLSAERCERARGDCRRVAEAIHRAFDHADLLLLPTTTRPATPASDPGSQLLFLALTVPFSLSGNPALTLPMGLVGGLPVGLQIVARRGAEALLLCVAWELEQALAWRARCFADTPDS